MTSAAPNAPVQRRLRGLTALAATVAVLLSLLVSSWLQYDRQRSAIAGLPDGDRRALYARTLRTLETTCHEHAASLAAFCGQQAELIVQFPECDDRCRLLALAHRPQPAR